MLLYRPWTTDCINVVYLIKTQHRMRVGPILLDLTLTMDSYRILKINEGILQCYTTSMLTQEQWPDQQGLL